MLGLLYHKYQFTILNLSRNNLSEYKLIQAPSLTIQSPLSANVFTYLGEVVAFCTLDSLTIILFCSIALSNQSGSTIGLSVVALPPNRGIWFCIRR